MKFRGRWIGVGAVALAGALWWIAIGKGARRVGGDGDWKPEAYVWQRSWNEGVRGAVRAEGRELGRLVVLSRQIEWEGETGRVVRVNVDWEALKGSGAEVAGAVRIGSFGGNFEGASAELVAKTVGEVIGEAREHGVKLAEVQIDFDAATSKLGEYRKWLIAAKRTAGELGAGPVTITALPSWMDGAGFGELAREAGYFVLQVHWLEHPSRADEPLVLCDVGTARRAVEKAGRVGVPFRVALPTYGYVVAFNADGSYAGMAAEGVMADWGVGKDVRLVEAQAEELAGLVKEWEGDRPMKMLGVIWYRLPVEGDELNWRWKTLEAVMNGRMPERGRLAVEVTRTAEGAEDLVLVNEGEEDAETGVWVRVTWGGGTLVAADGVGGFELASRGEQELELKGSGGWAGRLRAGEKRDIGWVRVEGGDVRGEVKSAY